MAQIRIHQDKAAGKQEALAKLCPFGAIEVADGQLSISAACKMCRLCIKKGDGVFEFVEDEVKPAVEKSQWRGIAVVAEVEDGSIHPVTLELIGKAKELAAKVSEPVFCLLIGTDITGKAKMLLEYGADINYQTHCDNINNQLFYESPPLVRAAEEDDIELLRYLLAHGADANVKSYDQTALHIICNANSQNLQESVRLLLAADADINVLDAKGRTPLDLLEKSTRHENSENMSRNREFLIQHGARHASELPISLNPAESDITAKLKAANPNADDTELAGVILHNKGAIPYTYSQTSKGNGFITVPGREGKLDIRCHDAHNDGTIYQHYWAQISLEDKNADQHRDIVVSYTLLQLDDNDQEVSQEPHSQVYIWDPVENAFLAP